MSLRSSLVLSCVGLCCDIMRFVGLGCLMISFVPCVVLLILRCEELSCLALSSGVLCCLCCMLCCVVLSCGCAVSS